MDFTPAQIAQFRKAYVKAVAAEAVQFSFDEHEFDTRYAGYLLEYFDMKKPKHKTS